MELIVRHRAVWLAVLPRYRNAEARCCLTWTAVNERLSRAKVVARCINNRRSCATVGLIDSEWRTLCFCCSRVNAALIWHAK